MSYSCFVTDNFNIPSFWCIFVSRLITSIETRNVRFFTFVYSVKGMISVILILVVAVYQQILSSTEQGQAILFFFLRLPSSGRPKYLAFSKQKKVTTQLHHFSLEIILLISKMSTVAAQRKTGTKHEHFSQYIVHFVNPNM